MITTLLKVLWINWISLQEETGESSQNMRSVAEDKGEMKLLLSGEENEVAYVLNPDCKI